MLVTKKRHVGLLDLHAAAQTQSHECRHRLEQMHVASHQPARVLRPRMNAAVMAAMQGRIRSAI
jgi:hypothetical protein